MEQGAGERVKEQSHAVVTVKTEVDKAAVYHEIQIDVNNTEEEPGFVEIMKSEPALLVKEEVVEDGWHDIAEQQCVHGPSTSAIVGSTNVFASSADLGNVLKIKKEPEATDIGPTVLQLMNTQGITNQTQVGECMNICKLKIDPILCGGVKEEIIEDAWRGSIAPQETLVVPGAQRSVDWHVKSPQTSNGSKRGATEASISSCNYCEKSFTRKTYLQNHITCVHAVGSYNCSLCDKSFKCKRYLMSHTAKVHTADSEPRTYICDYCKKMFNNKKGIQQHIANVHARGSYKCSECNKIFKCKAYLIMHTTKVHTPKLHTAGSEPRVYICEYCKKMFNNKKGIHQHIANVHASGSYKCRQCNKIFKCKDYLMMHTTGSHSQLYRCGECFKTYNSKRALGFHNRYVHGKETHKCTECDKEYKSKDYLRNHVRDVHSEQLYECVVCKATFKSKRTLKRHVKSLHTHKSLGLRTQIHMCDFCQKTFSTKSGLQKHKKNIHVAAHIHRCLRCNENFKSSDKLQQHKTSIHGKSQCQICLKLYTSKSTLRQHVKKAHNPEDIQFKSDLLKHEMPDSRPTAGDMNAAASTSAQQDNVVVAKEEPGGAELELGPVVFQHMDCNYRPYKEEPQDGD